MKYLTILFVVFCGVQMFANNKQNVKKDSFDMQKEYLTITKELNTIKDAKDFKKLMVLHKPIQNFKEKDDAKLTRKQIRALKLNLRLVLLNTFDNNFDSAFNAGDTIERYVQPPSGLESFYSGMPPKEIKDPQKRKEYEEAIKKNSEKIANYNFQTWIRRRKPRLLKEIAVYIIQNYSTEAQDIDEVTKAINTFISDKKTRAAIKEKIKDIRATNIY